MTAGDGTTGVLAIWVSTFVIAEIGLGRSEGFEVITATELAVLGEDVAAPPAASPVFALSSAAEHFGDGMVMTEIKLAKKRTEEDGLNRSWS